MPGPEPLPAGSSVSSPPGLELSPFRAVRYTTRDRSVLARLTSPAYDLIDPEGREALERTDPHNVVRLILPRADPGGGHDRYSQAARTLAAWREHGILAADAQPGLYVYEMTDGSTSTRGLVGAVGLADPAAGIILPHEDTMPGPVADRLALTTATSANFEPIVLVYDGGGEATEVVHGRVSDPPLISMTGADGVTHRVWPVVDATTIARIAADLAGHTAVIADGHHRYASYLLQQRHCHAKGAGPGPWDRGLAYLVATGAHGPQVQAIHRVLPALPLARAVESVARVMKVRPVSLSADGAEGLLAAQPRTCFLLTDGRSWYLLTDPDPAAVDAAVQRRRSAAWRTLDVTIAHHLLIRSVWKVSDDEAGVSFGHDVASTLAAVRGGGTALLLRPTPAESVLAVARNGERMPRKSTLFVPKPRNGLLLRAYAEEI
ncbi:MAG: DUF1015 family protein [Geodermatophilaceae bacterium]|nr:DUF1015 domain-containing protein [Geodermatophilaceae bacterium]